MFGSITVRRIRGCGAHDHRPQTTPDDSCCLGWRRHLARCIVIWPSIKTDIGPSGDTYIVGTSIRDARRRRAADPHSSNGSPDREIFLSALE